MAAFDPKSKALFLARSSQALIIRIYCLTALGLVATGKPKAPSTPSAAPPAVVPPIPPPHAQGKLVQVLKGSVLDVAVDLRVKSPTYGKHQVVALNDANHAQFYIPEGFAHGFLALENDTLFSYKCTSYYHASSEQTLLWSDPDLDIVWPNIQKIISEKDQIGLPLHQLDSPF